MMGQCLAGVAGRKRKITEVLNLGHDIGAQQDVILHDQDGFIAAFDSCAACIRGQFAR